MIGNLCFDTNQDREKGDKSSWHYLLLAAIGFTVWVVAESKMSSAPKNDWEKITRDAPLDNQYNHLGKYEVQKKEHDAP